MENTHWNGNSKPSPSLLNGDLPPPPQSLPLPLLTK